MHILLLQETQVVQAKLSIKFMRLGHIQYILPMCLASYGLW